MYPLTLAMAIGNEELGARVRASLQDLPMRVVIEHADTQELTPFLERLERIRPEVVLLDIHNWENSLEDSIAQVKAAAPESMIVCLHTSAAPETILAAMRAGAHEYLYPPLETQLRQALQRKAAERSRNRQASQSGARSLAFFSAKGGCGATTLACHTAVELGRHGQKVLLADLDLEAGMIAFLMKTKTPYSVLDAVNNLQRLDLSYWKGLVSNGIPGVEIIPATNSMACRQHTLQLDQFRHVLGFVRSHYDFTVVDLGRSLNYLALHVLEEIDTAFLVTTLDVPALHQAKHLVKMLMERGYGKDRIRLLLNKVGKRVDVTAEELEKMLGIDIHASLPDDQQALYESYAEGRLLGRDTALARRVGQLARKLAGVPEEKPKSKFLRFG
ncbi:MAG TPA: AAA family ATPase [Bryobacteraceae bacterium]|nr:AAA family ATPase [Bryobacteraceae bacterium]